MKRYVVSDLETDYPRYRTNYFVLALLAAIWITIKDYFTRKD